MASQNLSSYDRVEEFALHNKTDAPHFANLELVERCGEEYRVQSCNAC